MTAPRPAPLDFSRADRAEIARLLYGTRDLTRQKTAKLSLARAEIGRLADLLAQARTDLAVANEIIEQQRAALDAVRAALPNE